MITRIVPIKFDIREPEILADPYPFYRRLHADDATRWNSQRGWCRLTRYDDVAAALRDHRLSSARTGILFNRLLRGAASNAGPEDLAVSTRVRAAMMLYTDPPVHTRLRGIVHAAFKPAVVERMRADVQGIVDDLLDEVQGSDRFDVIHALAFPLPALVMIRLLGLQVEDLPFLKRWSDAFADVGVGGSLMAEAADHAILCLSEFTAYLQSFFVERRLRPKDDLLSLLIAARSVEGMLTDDELIATCMSFLIGGHETTIGLIGNGLLALLRHPDQLGDLRDDPSLIGSAIEEVLRYDSPVQMTSRLALEEIEIGDKCISRGRFVECWIGAANRDPARFPDPDRLDIRRPDNRHLAFSHGVHYCIGAALARLEGAIAINTFLHRFPHVKLADDRALTWKPSRAFRTLTSLPVIA